MTLEKLAGPVSLFPYVFNNKGPGRRNSSGKFSVFPANRKTWLTLSRDARAMRFSERNDS